MFIMKLIVRKTKLQQVFAISSQPATIVTSIVTQDVIATAIACNSVRKMRFFWKISVRASAALRISSAHVLKSSIRELVNANNALLLNVTSSASKASSLTRLSALARATRLANLTTNWCQALVSAVTRIVADLDASLGVTPIRKLQRVLKTLSCHCPSLRNLRQNSMIQTQVLVNFPQDSLTLDSASSESI